MCPGSSAKNYSGLFGGSKALLEISNTEITGGSFIYGNIQIENSTISHADIQGVLTQDVWSPDDKITRITYTDILDSTNEPVGLDYSGPNQIYGNANLIGSSDQRIIFERTKTPITMLGGRVINGPQIFATEQVISISEGAKIRDSLIRSTNNEEHLNSTINIYGGSSLSSSVIFGNVNIFGGATISSSVIEEMKLENLPAKTIFISEAEIIEGFLHGNGTVKDKDTKIERSEISDDETPSSNMEKPFLISNGSKISDSRVSGSEVSNSTIKEGSSLALGKFGNKSTVSNSTVYGGITDNSEILNGSYISISNIKANSMIDDSIVSESTIENSKVLSKSAVANLSVVSEESTIINSIIGGSIIRHSTLTGPIGVYENIVNSRCYPDTSTETAWDYKCSSIAVP